MGDRQTQTLEMGTRVYTRAGATGEVLQVGSTLSAG